MKNFFLYARKSSEAEDRQTLSIDSQIKELKNIAGKRGIKIIEFFTEAKSAKAPGRPVFNQMLQRFLDGEAEGIICWKLDRLARNPIDGGAIQWAVKQNNLVIETPSQTYSRENESTLIMSLEFGMAQKFIDDLGKNSKRGMKTKAELGWYPAPAPIGYLNTPDRKKGFKVIEKNPVSFALVRKCFELVMGGEQAITVWKKAHDEWRMAGRIGHPISRSAFYYMLTNPFYFGEFEWPNGSGNWYKGKHEPLVTRDEFDLVQRMLGRDGKPVAKTHVFDLTGIMRCGECGCAITASKKTKYYRKTDRFVTYVYYHCTKKRSVCSQHPITEKDLNGQIGTLLMSLRLKPEFIDWAKKWLKVLHEKESGFQEATLKNQQDNLSHIENKLNRLLDMRLDDLLGEKQYEEKKQDLEKERQDIKEHLSDTDNNLTGWRQKIESAMDFAYAAENKFNTGTRADKHEVLLRIGSNLILENGEIRLDLKKYYKIFSEQGQWEQKYKDWLEPQECRDIITKRPDLRPAIPVWLPR